MALVDPAAGAGKLGDDLMQEALPDFVLIRTDEVDEGERLRALDPVWAQALGQMMARDGQDTPIQVCRLPGRNSWTLVAGAHRLAGARAVGIEHLRAEVVNADRDARRLREVRENLWRSDLTPMDRAAFIAEAVAIYKRRAGLDPARDGRVASVTVRWQKQVAEEADDTSDTMSRVYGWSAKVGEQIGLTKRTIERDLMLYRRLAPSIVSRLREARHPILSNASQLRALAKLEPTEQEGVVDKLVGAVVNGRTITSVAQARDLASGADKPLIRPEDKRRNTIFSTIQRMSTREVRDIFADTTFHRLLPGNVQRLLAPLLGEFGDEQPAAAGVENALTPAEEAADLRRTIKMAVDFLSAGTDASFLIRELVGEEEDEEYHVQEVDAGWVLAMDGVTVTADQAGEVLLTAWLRAAELRATELEQPIAAIDAVAADVLSDAVGFIAEQLGKDMDAGWIVGELSRRYEAKSRFANGAYELNLGKVTSTCTAGGENLLRAWVTKARTRISAADRSAA